LTIYFFKDNRKYVLKGRSIANAKEKHSFEKELFILRRLRHPLIVHLETSFQEGTTAYLVMPFYEQGTLADWIERNPTSDNRPRLKNIFRGVCQALCFLHSNSIIHADVKLSNILMAGDKPVLSDFDISSDSTFFDVTQTHSMAPGTLQYMAPELFEPGARISFSSDLYAFGVCIFISHWGSNLYLPPSEPHVQLPSDRDVSLITLLENLLTRDPLARLSADECLAHEWFRTVPESQTTNSTSLEGIFYFFFLIFFFFFPFLPQCFARCSDLRKPAP
jgi:serine/threonine protein kinase